MAVNRPVGDSARKGAVKKRSQAKTKLGGAQAQQEVRGVHGGKEAGEKDQGGQKISRACGWRRRLGKGKKREQAGDVDRLTFVMAASEGGTHAHRMSACVYVSGCMSVAMASISDIDAT